jgi:hypothetical protein
VHGLEGGPPALRRRSPASGHVFGLGEHIDRIEIASSFAPDAPQLVNVIAGVSCRTKRKIGELNRRPATGMAMLRRGRAKSVTGDLGRRFPARSKECVGARQLRLVRDKRELGLPNNRRSSGRNRRDPAQPFCGESLASRSFVSLPEQRTRLGPDQMHSHAITPWKHEHPGRAARAE